MCAAVGAGLWTYGLVMDTIVRPLTVGIADSAGQRRHRGRGHRRVSWLMFALRAVRAPCAADRRPTPGSCSSCSTPSAWRCSTPGRDRRPTTAASAAVVEHRRHPRVVDDHADDAAARCWSTSLVAASMDPLGVWLAHLRGLPVPSVVNTFVLFMPNYACAVVAIAAVARAAAARPPAAPGAGDGQLSPRRAARPRRHGRGVARAASAAGAQRGHQAGSARSCSARAATPRRDSMLRRFEREAQATAALSSPHTIRAVRLRRHRRPDLLLRDGAARRAATSSRWCANSARCRPTARVFLLRQVCHSLAEAHARGLVHRDITPANIYVCRMGLDYDFVKVLDFGLVKFNDQRAIEQHADDRRPHDDRARRRSWRRKSSSSGDVDQRADVYALGCVAYYLLTGQLVFEADTPMKMFVQHLQATPIPPSQRTELPIPASSTRWCWRASRRNRRKRPQDAAAVLEKLRHCRFADSLGQRLPPECGGNATSSNSAARSPPTISVSNPPSSPARLRTSVPARRNLRPRGGKPPSPCRFGTAGASTFCGVSPQVAR